jgi:hypothetical protein
MNRHCHEGVKRRLSFGYKLTRCFGVVTYIDTFGQIDDVFGDIRGMIAHPLQVAIDFDSGSEQAQVFGDRMCKKSQQARRDPVLIARGSAREASRNRSGHGTDTKNARRRNFRLKNLACNNGVTSKRACSSDG